MEELIPVMSPEPGSRAVRFVGDQMRFSIQDRDGRYPQPGWRALLRTNLGRAEALRREIIEAHTYSLPPAGASWRDLPMELDGQGWSITLPLAEPGYFKSKAYLVNPEGWQRWPDGPDFGLSVHPDACRTGNTIYCAFTRMFGKSKTEAITLPPTNQTTLESLDEADYTVIPPSGKLRDLIIELPHIFQTLGCRILHLLPIHPTPTTYARFGRFGSPYAALDLTAIDPALVVFDRRTTGIDQFCELAYQTHVFGGRLFLDIIINHTGWGSLLQDNHPDWFVRQDDGTFVSPGAWGTTWEDLVELKHQNVALWDKLASMFLTWCRRGVDGFRCDAGYKVPVAAWQYIIASVQQEFPNTVFLLEGLGGAWDATEALLSEGGMQWAYSELFQNYSGREVASYLDHSMAQSARSGLLVHYSETHDNERLAVKGKTWSLARNNLCALTSLSGGYGFTCGVEWLAAEKIRVHESTGTNWGAPDNIVPQLARLNKLLGDHPCFFDGAKLTRLSEADSIVYALLRESQEGKDKLLVLVNTDGKAPAEIILKGLPGVEGWFDLSGTSAEQAGPKCTLEPGDRVSFALSAGAAHCLSPNLKPLGLAGEAYRHARAQAAFALKALNDLLPTRTVPLFPWRELAGLVEDNPIGFLAAVCRLRDQVVQLDSKAPLPPAFTSFDKFKEEIKSPAYRRVVIWEAADVRRITPVPPAHWLLIRDNVRFRVTLEVEGHSPAEHLESIPVRESHIACFSPPFPAGDAWLHVERYDGVNRPIHSGLRLLRSEPLLASCKPAKNDLVLLTNGRGGMARICVDLGQVRSKYDCVLGANLHPTLPVDRHIFVKRIRVWVNADGFISPLNFHNVADFEPGPPAMWQFVANAGDGRIVEIEMAADMIEGQNATLFSFRRPSEPSAPGKQLPAEADVRLTVRCDIEDRNFHCETKRNGGADYHFSTNCHPLPFDSVASGAAESFRGFAFTPAADRNLRVVSDGGTFHPQPEWSQNIPHPVEETRGQEGYGDAYSPGWFDLPLPKATTARLIVTAEKDHPSALDIDRFHDAIASVRDRQSRRDCIAQPKVARHELPWVAGSTAPNPEGVPASGGVGAAPRASNFEPALLQACRAFVVRRGSGKTVIAGYPWFLDWGRDTFICARGLIAAGMVDEVTQILTTFARFEKDGTLPNTIFGEDASNRDTSDAPLWFGLVCEELAAVAGPGVYQTKVRDDGTTLADTLRSIAANYINGTPNGIRMDSSSALIWSPSHFTWMDTNYPASTPRQGYPIEIQALWIRLLGQLHHVGTRTKDSQWDVLADKALASVQRFFWLADRGYYSDCLISEAGRPASDARVDDALRSNFLFLISLGLSPSDRARSSIEAASRYLVIPGALRTLAPLPVSLPLPIYGADGRLLNDPLRPYWGHYEGDEDTCRKPAYHNGTAWTWTFPTFCEAVAVAHDFSPESIAAARAYLGSMDGLMSEGCLGQLPEILDGDAPHIQRGCDAQAWAATEAIRVWKKLADTSGKSQSLEPKPG